jgi:hypothetical protein
LRLGLLFERMASRIDDLRIRGTAQRERLKEALATFSMKIASESVNSGVPLPAEQAELLDSFVSRARVMANRTGCLLCDGATRINVIAAANYGLFASAEGPVLWAEPRETLASGESKATALDQAAPKGMVYCYYFTSWKAVEPELSWTHKARDAETKGASAVVFITESAENTVPDVVPKTLTENPELQVDIPVVFVARGEGGEVLFEATQQRRHATLIFDQLRNFSAVTADELPEASS